MLIAMNLPGALIFYTGSFLVIGGCAVLGVFIGKTLRKRKDAKETIEDIMSIFSKEKDGKESTKSKEAVTSEDVIDRDMKNVSGVL